MSLANLRTKFRHLYYRSLRLPNEAKVFVKRTDDYDGNGEGGSGCRRRRWRCGVSFKLMMVVMTKTMMVIKNKKEEETMIAMTMI